MLAAQKFQCFSSQCALHGLRALDEKSNTKSDTLLGVSLRVSPKTARQKGDSKREKPDPERTFSQIFADFC